MSLGLEFIGEYGVVQRNFDKLDAEVLGTGGIDAGIRFGTGTWSFPGGTRSSNATTVTHGLGTTPAAVFVQTSNRFIVWDVTAVGATTFATTGMEVDGGLVGAGGINFYWLAVG